MAPDRLCSLKVLTDVKPRLLVVGHVMNRGFSAVTMLLLLAKCFSNLIPSLEPLLRPFLELIQVVLCDAQDVICNFP